MPTRSWRGARIIWRMRVPRTFVFVDLSGFTNYTAAFGDNAAGRILSTFRAIVREVASDRGVRIAKWLGDGFMAVGVEQIDAITFTLELERRAADVCAPLTLRAGVASGHALLFEGDDYLSGDPSRLHRTKSPRRRRPIRGPAGVIARRAADPGH